MKFVVIDHIRDAGDDSTPNTGAIEGGKPNDDWIGYDERVAVVADGATGLGGKRLVSSDDSDAQWIAKASVNHFLNARTDDAVRDLVREINDHAVTVVARENDLADIPRYAWPMAGFIMARMQDGIIEISGLGDCVALIRMSDGFVERFSALPQSGAAEISAARQSMERDGCSWEAIRSPQVLDELRERRAANNTPESGVWTLGLSREACEHVFTIALPVPEVDSIMLMSDGFSAAEENYGLYDRAGMIEAARGKGLASILAEIRHVERIIDPEATRYPRYKRSDDSSAILLAVDK